MNFEMDWWAHAGTLILLRRALFRWSPSCEGPSAWHWIKPAHYRVSEYPTVVNLATAIIAQFHISRCSVHHEKH